MLGKIGITNVSKSKFAICEIDNDGYVLIKDKDQGVLAYDLESPYGRPCYGDIFSIRFLDVPYEKFNLIAEVKINTNITLYIIFQNLTFSDTYEYEFNKSGSFKFREYNTDSNILSKNSVIFYRAGGYAEEDARGSLPCGRHTFRTSFKIEEVKNA